PTAPRGHPRRRRRTSAPSGRGAASRGPDPGRRGPPVLGAAARAGPRNLESRTGRCSPRFSLRTDPAILSHAGRGVASPDGACQPSADSIWSMIRSVVLPGPGYPLTGAPTVHGDTGPATALAGPLGRGRRPA